MPNKAICIIPARGGSKRIPKKNIKEFFGKPLIAYSIEVALKSQLFDDVIVSTDDKKIADVAKNYGANIQMRPKELSDDYTGTDEVIKYVLDTLKQEGKKYDYVCTIYATAPFLQSKYLIQGFEELKNSDAKNSFSATSMPFPIQRTFKLDDNGRCQMFNPEHYYTRSQDLDEAYQDAGQFYWSKLNKKSDEIMFGKDSIPIILPRYLVQDIDTIEDWIRAEYMYGAIFPDKYDKWNKLKKELHNKKTIYFNQRDIVFISLGQNIGNEQYGKGEEFLRPVIVIKKFNQNLFLGIPLSSKEKNGYFFYNVKFKNKTNTALLLQSRTFDSRRIKYRIATLSHTEFNKVLKRFYEVITPLENGERLLSNFDRIISKEDLDVK